MNSIKKLRKNSLIANYIYNRKGKLTSQPFLTDIVIYDLDGNPIKKDEVTFIYIYGKINKGDYISTYYLKGTGFKTNMKEVACAISMSDKYTEGLELISVKIL